VFAERARGVVERDLLARNEQRAQAKFLEPLFGERACE
jgi:hypothetical protein